MKKIAIVLLVIVVLCALCACDPKPNKGGSTNNSQGSSNDDFQNEQEITKMYITIYDNKLEVTLENNCAVKDLVGLLKQGNITYTASDYGGFEKVGNIGHGLTTNDKQITTQAGDVVLYQGNQICIMVGSNSWSYTRIGRLNGFSSQQLRELIGIGKGSAQVTISLD